jgi:uncharacterized protein
MVTLYFLDSSAIVKRYVPEVGTEWIQEICDRQLNHPLFVAGITWVEVLSAVACRHREGSFSAAQISQIHLAIQNHWSSQYRIVEIEQTLIRRAGELVNQYPLRAYDAVQLASALRVQEALTNAQLPGLVFLSADDRLLMTAQAAGLLVDNPNHY